MLTQLQELALSQLGTHALTWAQLQGPRKLYPTVPLHRGREYQPAHTHGDVAAFLARQIARGLKVKHGAR